MRGLGSESCEALATVVGENSMIRSDGHDRMISNTSISGFPNELSR